MRHRFSPKPSALRGHGKFVLFEAEGYKFMRNIRGEIMRDRTGSPIVGEILTGEGVVKAGPEELGCIYRQCPQLLSCDSVNYQTF